MVRNENPGVRNQREEERNQTFRGERDGDLQHMSTRQTDRQADRQTDREKNLARGKKKVPRASFRGGFVAKMYTQKRREEKNHSFASGDDGLGKNLGIWRAWGRVVEMHGHASFWRTTTGRRRGEEQGEEEEKKKGQGHEAMSLNDARKCK